MPNRLIEMCSDVLGHFAEEVEASSPGNHNTRLLLHTGGYLRVANVPERLSSRPEGQGAEVSERNGRASYSCTPFIRAT